MKLLKITRNFSLLTKVPKTVAPAKIQKSWLSKLFSSNESSATYILLKELFEYLQGNQIFQKQFPLLKNTERIQQNCMIMHTHLLRDRIKQEIDVPRSEIQKFNYNLQTHFFPDFAAYVNTSIPTQNFRQHYAEAYMKKLDLFSDLTKDHELAIDPNRQILTFQQYAPMFRGIVYENRVQQNHVELLKFCKYYVAHKKYLNMLEWNDMAKYKVKWGLQSLKHIDQVQSAPENAKK